MPRTDLDPNPYNKLVERIRSPRNSEPQNPISSTLPMRRARCNIYQSGALVNVPNNTLTAVAFDTEITDSVGLHSTTTNNSRITIPSIGRVSGIWLLHAHVIWAAGAGGTVRTLEIRKNGSTYVATTSNPPAGTTLSQDALILVDDPAYGDYYEAIVFQDSGAGLNLVGASPRYTYFEAVHLW